MISFRQADLIPSFDKQSLTLTMTAVIKPTDTNQGYIITILPVKSSMSHNPSVEWLQQRINPVILGYDDFFKRWDNENISQSQMYGSKRDAEEALGQTINGIREIKGVNKIDGAMYYDHKNDIEEYEFEITIDKNHREV